MVVKHEVLEKSRHQRAKRRRIIWLSICGALVLLIVYFSLYSFTDIFIGSQKSIASAPTQTDTWTMFRRDLSHTGLSGTSSTAPSGSVKWTFTAGGVIHSSPAVVDGVVYFGSRDQHLYAVDANTGKEIWAFKTGSWVESSPVVVNGVVYFGCNDSTVYAVDAATGTEKWHTKTVYAIRSSPAVADGVVYIGTDDYKVFAIDASNGKVKWSRKTGNMVISAPAVNNGVVAVGCSDGIFYTYNAGNGRPRLQFKTASIFNGSPVIRDNIAYIADANGWFYAIDITQKNWLWENKIRQYWNVLYLYGIAPKPSLPSGLLWNYQTVFAYGINTVSSPVLDGDYAYLGVGNNVVSVDIPNHKTAWTFSTKEAVTSTPIVVGDDLLAASQDGYLYCLDKNNGTKIWDLQLGAASTSSPTVANGVLYIGCDDGKLYAIQ